MGRMTEALRGLLEGLFFLSRIMVASSKSSDGQDDRAGNIQHKYVGQTGDSGPG